MKQMKHTAGIRRIFSLLLAAVLLYGCCGPSFAERYVTSEYRIAKLSNPQNEVGEADGLYPENRSTGAACAMAERDGKLYIATRTELSGEAIGRLQQALADAGNGLSDEMLWQLIDLATDGDLPHPDEDAAGTILIYDSLTGEMSELDGARQLIRQGCVIKSAILVENTIYFSTGCAESGDGCAQILRLDRNDQLTELFCGTAGSTLEPCCVLDGKLYFGGTDGSEALHGDTGQTLAGLTVICLEEQAESGWTRVADDRDFGAYAADPCLTSSRLAPIGALCAFDGSLWMTLSGSSGFLLFEGHPAASGEASNAYGWCWTEIVGRQNGKNYPGLAPDADGYTGDGSDDALLSVSASLCVFQGELYVFDRDYFEEAVLSAAEGYAALSNGGKAAALVDPIERVLRHPQRVCRLDRETGVFEEMTAFTELVRDGCVEGILCAASCQGELFLGTQDCALVYEYLTGLTAGNFMNWSATDWLRELGYLQKMLELLRPYLEADAQNNKYLIFLNEILERIELLSSVIDPDMAMDPETAAYLIENWETILQNIETLLLRLWEEINDDEAANELARAVLREDWDDPSLSSALAGLLCVCCGVDAGMSAAQRGKQLKAALGAPAAARDLPFETLTELILSAMLQDLSEHFEQALAWTRQLIDAFDRESLEKFLRITDVVRQSKAGFDLLKTSDGEHWTVVSDDGFGDRYNDAAQSLLETDTGLCIGTMNLWYGAQLWLCSRIAEGECPRDESCPLSAFSDVDPNAWYHDGVHWCLAQGIMNGVSSDRFAPSAATTRAQVVTMLWRMAGEPEPGISDTGFTDVVRGSYYETAVCWAVENEIVKGVSQSKFSPQDELTREQLAAILFRYAGAEAPEDMEVLKPFGDMEDISNYAKPAMCWAVSVGILNGTGNGRLSPKNSASRAQVATMLLRFMKQAEAPGD